MAVHGAVGAGITYIEPIAMINYGGAELLALDKLDKCRDDGDNFLIGNKIDYLWIDTINACELVGAMGVAEDVAQVGNVFARDIDVAVFAR